MDNPLELRRRAARRLIVMPANDLGVREVYAVRRPISVDFAELAERDVLQARDEAVLRQDEDERLAACSTDQERAAVREHVAAIRKLRSDELLKKLDADGDARAAMLQRAGEAVIAAVEGIGIALDDVDGDGAPKVQAGPQPIGADVEDVCQPIFNDGGRPAYLARLRYVPLGVEPGECELSIRELSDQERLVLGTLIVAAFSKKGEVTPFRDAAQPAGAGRPVGAPVRPAAERAADRRGGRARGSRAGGEVGPRGDGGGRRG